MNNKWQISGVTFNLKLTVLLGKFHRTLKRIELLSRNIVQAFMRTHWATRTIASESSSNWSPSNSFPLAALSSKNKSPLNGYTWWNALTFTSRKIVRIAYQHGDGKSLALLEKGAPGQIQHNRGRVKVSFTTRQQWFTGFQLNERSINSCPDNINLRTFWSEVKIANVSLTLFIVYRSLRRIVNLKHTTMLESFVLFVSLKSPSDLESFRTFSKRL